MRSHWVRALAKRAWTSEYVVFLVLFLVFVVLLQLRSGAYSAGFHDDSPGHVTSALFVHDYLRTIWANPLRFLIDYHGHFPLVSIGHWGPAWYVVEGVWMLVFGTSRTACLLLAAAVTAGIATTIYWIARPRFGGLPAVLTAGAFIVSPLVQYLSDEVLLDGPVTLLTLISAILYARYLQTGRWQWSLSFAALASAALLVKGNAGCLALLPPLAVVIGRRYDLLRTSSFWVPIPVVAILVGPWYWYTYRLASVGFRFHWGWDYTSTALGTNPSVIAQAIGLALPLAGLAGFLLVATAPRRVTADPVLICIAALLAAVWVFQLVVPVDTQARYLEPALPSLLLLANVPMRQFARSQVARALVFAVLMLPLIPLAAEMPSLDQDNLRAIVADVWAKLPQNNRAVLIVGDAVTEGEAIVQLALKDSRRPSVFAVRGSRLLAGGGYNNYELVPLFESPEQIMTAIDSYRIPLVLFRSNGSSAEWPHIRQVSDAIRQYPARWELVAEDVNGSPPSKLFRIQGNAEQPADPSRLVALSAPRALVPAQ